MQLEEVEMADQNADVAVTGKWKFPVFVFFQDARFPFLTHSLHIY